MKNIGFLLLILLLIVISYDVGAQSRNAATTALKIDTQSEKLRQATGWKKDILGDWVSNNNAISDAKLDEHSMSTVPQNFKWIQFVSLKSGAQDIYALLYENSEYISSVQNERRVHFFLMAAESYMKIADAISLKDGQTITIHSPSYGYMSDKEGEYSSSRLIALMNQAVINDTGTQQYDFSVNAQHVDNEDIVRFRLPEKSSIMSSSLTNSYFEVKWTDFNNIMLPPLAVKKNTDEFSLDAAPVISNGIIQARPSQQEKNGLEDRNMPSRANDNDFDITNDAKQSVARQEPDSAIVSDDELTDRIAKEKAVVSSPVTSFANIKGWYHTSDGEWVNDDSHRYDFETVGRYEWRKFLYKDETYWLLVRYEKYAGESYYLISQKDYLQTLQELDRSSVIKFRVLAYAGIGYSFDDVIALCEKTLDTPKKEDAIIFKDRYLVLQYKLSETKNIARFFIFLQECSRYGSETALENCNIIVSDKIRYNDEPLLMSESMFSKMYYESPYNDFMRFFRKPASATGIAPAQSNRQSQEIDF